MSVVFDGWSAEPPDGRVKRGRRRGEPPSAGKRERRFASRVYRWSARGGVLLALTVIVLGATVRLSDAGLSCPDWPGCYGQLTVSAAAASPETVQARWPDHPLEPERAHLEMFHRYAAGTLGVLILVVAVNAWRRHRARVAGSALLGLLVFQALLGMWTVTLKLEPLIVVGHLIGGLAILSVLWWLVLDDALATSIGGAQAPVLVRDLRPVFLKTLALVGLGVLLAQIALGGWTASNHAALACQGFPTCNGAWWPRADFAAGFAPAADGAFDAPTGAGLIAIHWTHRLGALALVLVLGSLVLASTRAPGAIRRAGLVVGALLLIQVGLGIANVLAGIALPLAVAHNAVAALLLLAVLTLNHRLAGGRFIAGESP